jgi:pimeloyl-ACP methyl ester carboxylesterase
VRGLALRPGGVRRALQASVWDDALVTPELVAAYLDRVRIEGVVDAYYGLTAPLRSSRSESSQDEEIDFADIAVPTLVLWGRDDALISVDSGKKAAERIPGAQFVVLDRTGHLPMEERPEDLLRIARGFWDGVEQRTR